LPVSCFDVEMLAACSLFYVWTVNLRLKCDDSRAETIYRLSAKRTSPFKSAGGSVQSATGSRGVRIGVINLLSPEFYI
jgi:hypothetical protein